MLARWFFWAAAASFAFEFVYSGSATLLIVALLEGHLMALGAFADEGEQ